MKNSHREKLNFVRNVWMVKLFLFDHALQRVLILECNREKTLHIVYK